MGGEGPSWFKSVTPFSVCPGRSSVGPLFTCMPARLQFYGGYKVAVGRTSRMTRIPFPPGGLIDSMSRLGLVEKSIRQAKWVTYAARKHRKKMGMTN